jgi:aerobic-type carbon monoxide dehydrogenase small subunit (CoxS/CutS family)
MSGDRDGAQNGHALVLTVNGVPHTVEADRGVPLLTVLRDELHLTGSKYGCGEGQCGACTVLIAGEAMHACQLSVGEVGSRSVETIEGLSAKGVHSRLQQAFIEAGAFQCGVCTPGMVMAATALLRRNPHPSAHEIRLALNGNICRCGTYNRILKAVQRAAEASSNA